MTLYEPYAWDDGYVGYRLVWWAALVNLVLLSGFSWALLAALVRAVL